MCPIKYLLFFYALLCLSQAYPAVTKKEHHSLSSVLDESDESNADYNEKMSKIFDLPNYQSNGPTIITNCENVICIDYSLCFDDKVLTNGTQLFDWRLSPRVSSEEMAKKGKILVCEDMEVPCCADEAMKHVNETSQEKGPTRYDPTEVEKDEDDDDEEDIVHAKDDNKVLNIQKCGYGKSTSSRMYSGDEMQPNEYPWLVGVFFRLPTDKLRYLGGGSLIHESVILTAAHLLLEFTPEQLVVRAGEHDILEILPDGKRQEQNVSNIIIHEELYANGLINDIALIILKKPFELTNFVNTICLPPQSVHTDDGIMCTTGGWGKNAANYNGKYQAKAKKIQLPIVEQKKCENILRKTRLGPFYILHNSLMCAGGDRQDACKGDGGSPLFCEIPHDVGRLYQKGIVAGGIGCGRKVPGMYVNVAHFSNWIIQQFRYININMRPENILHYELFE